MLATGAGLLAWKNHERALAETGRESRNMAPVLGDHTGRSFQSAGIMQVALIERLGGTPRGV